MASSGLVHVDSDALTSLKSALAQAQNSAQQTLRSAETEVNKTLKLLEERLRHWEQVRVRCLRQLHMTQDARARSAAQECVDEAERKIRLLHVHVNSVKDSAKSFRNSVRDFVQCLYEPIRILDKLLAVLERYHGGNSTGLAASVISAGANKIDYGVIDATNGRRTGIHATITPDMINTGTDANPSIIPPGYEKYKRLARGHLLAKQLGGSGDDPRNLVTLYQNPTNTPWMRDIETAVKKAVESGEDVDYQVVPIYRGKEPIPFALTIIAKGTGGFWRAISIYNRAKH